MLNNEQEYFFKDFFIITSALFGFFILVIVQLRNLGFRFRPLGRRAEDIDKRNILRNNKQFSGITFNKNNFQYNKCFELSLDTHHGIWYISTFTTKKLNSKLRLKKINDHYWYYFSSTKLKTEKIMLPLCRKILNKYKKKFDSDKSIQFTAKNYEECNLYTWLKNESHIHTVIYKFLDECVYIASQLNLKPSLVVNLSDTVTLELTLPRAEELLKFEDELKSLYAIEFSHDKEMVKITLWIAFSSKNIPKVCIQNYADSKIIPEYRKIS